MATTSERRPLRGRTVLVTGGTGGIGYQTARALAQRGAQVLITGREPGPGEDAAAAIRRQSGHELVRFLQADHTGELLPLLQASAPARCVNVVSAGFKMWKPDPFPSSAASSLPYVPSP